jgi:hypothetical protein
MLLVFAILAFAWGGLCLLGGCGGLVDAVHNVFSVFRLPGGVLAVGPLRIGRAIAIAILCIQLVQLLLAMGVIVGGILLLLRWVLGRNLVIGCTVGMGVCALTAIGVLATTIPKEMILAPCGVAFGVLMIYLLVLAVFMKLQENPEVNKALR